MRYAMLVFVCFGLASVGAVPRARATATVEPVKAIRGSWGGPHIGLTAEKGTVTLDLDCAHASMDGPIRLDSNGAFDVTGVFVRERGGPARRDETADTHPARFV